MKKEKRTDYSKNLSERELAEINKRMDEAIEKDIIEYDKWWKTLTPQQQKEHDDDVSRLCDVEI